MIGKGVDCNIPFQAKCLDTMRNRCLSIHRYTTPSHVMLLL